MADIGAKIVITADNSNAMTGLRQVREEAGKLGPAAATSAQQGAQALTQQGAAATRAAAETATAAAATTQGAATTAAASEHAAQASRQQGDAATGAATQTTEASRTTAAATSQGAAAAAAASDRTAQASRQQAEAATGAATKTSAASGTTSSAASQSAAATAAASDKASQAMHGQAEAAGVSARQTAAAMRTLPAQFTDIATSLAGGQNPLLVLMQQGGQIKDSFGGIGPAARALGGYVAGLVGPFTLAAGAAAVLAVAYSQGSDEAQAYSRALILNGNAAGLTADKLQAAAARIDGVVGTQAAAAAALAQFAGATAIDPSGMEQFATAALKMERAVGTSVADTVKQFSALGQAPLQESIKLNAQINYLTVSTYQQIRALTEQGKTVEAAAVAQKAYADALESRAGQIEERLGTFERMWRGVKSAAAEAWDAMLGVGRQATLGDQIDAAAKKVQDLQGFVAKGGRKGLFGEQMDDGKDELAAAQAELARLRGQKSDADTKAQQEADQAENVKKTISAQDYIDKLHQQTDATGGLTRALAEYRRNAEQLAKNGSPINAAQQAKDIEAIRAKYTDKSALAGADAALALQRARDQAASNERIRAVEADEQALAVTRAQGLLSTDDYERQRVDIQRRRLAERETLLQQEIALEQRRRPPDAAGRTQQQARVVGLQDQLAGVRQERTQLPVVAQAGIEQRALEESRQRAQEWSQAWTEANGRVTQLAEQNAKSRAALISDPVQRAAAELDLQVGEIQRQAKELTDKLDLKLSLTVEPGQRELLQTQITEIGEQSATAITLANAGLAERMRPGWQKMVEGWTDSTRLMRETFDTLTTGIVQQGEEAFVKFGKEGKLSVKELADFIQTELLRAAYRKTIGAQLGNVTDGLLKSAAGAFGFGGQTAGAGLRVPGVAPAGGAVDASGAVGAISLAGGRLGVPSTGPRLGGAPAAAASAGATSAADAASSLQGVSTAAQQVTTNATSSAAALASQGQVVVENAAATQTMTAITKATQSAETSKAADKLVEDATVSTGMRAVGDAAVETAIKLKVAGAVSGGASGSAVGHVFTGATRFATGGAFTNSVATAPTFFNFQHGGRQQLGVMGEAGDEAVMPLRRSGGAHTVDAVDRSGRLVGGMQLRRGPGGRLAVQAFADGGTFGSTGGSVSTGTGARLAQTMSRPASAATAGAGSGVTVNLRPVIQIDSRTDQGQISQLVSSALQQGRKQMVAELKAQGVMR
jgi:phage-related minor tail protein